MEKVYTGKDIEQILVLSQNVISLNTPVKNDETQESEIELGDYIEDPSPTPEEQFIIEEKQRRVMSLLDKYLNKRERDIIVSRFGLETGKAMTLDKIGEQYGICRERVRQIEAHALRKLRQKCARDNVVKENF